MKKVTIIEIIIIVLLFTTTVLLSGCTSENTDQYGGQTSGNSIRGGAYPRDGNFSRDRNFPRDNNFGMNPPNPEQMLPQIIQSLELPNNSTMTDVKLYLGLSEDSSQEELMQALKDKNILGGRFKWKNIFL